MRSSRTLLVICLLQICISSIQAEQFCSNVLVDDHAVFNLCPLYQMDVQKITDGVNLYSISLVDAKVPSCDTQRSQGKVFATQTDIATKRCSDITNTTKPRYSLVDTSDKDSGLVMRFERNSLNDLNLVVNLMCNKTSDSKANPEFKVDNYDPVKKIITLSASHKLGCAQFDLSLFTNFMKNNKYLFTGICVAIGLFVGLFGLKLFKPAIFIVGALLGAMVACQLFFSLLTFGKQAWVYYTLFGVSVTIGLGVGALAVYFQKFGFFAVGALLGVILGLFINLIALVHITKSLVAFYAVVALCALIFGLAAFTFRKTIVIIATSIIGGYLTVRSLGYIIGHFPDELNVAKGAQKMDVWAYGYLGGAVLLALAFIYFQYFLKNRTEEKEEEDKYNKQAKTYYTRV